MFSVVDLFASHAPRERVSWNICITCGIFAIIGHAPRERVSWNCRFSMHWILLPVTLHVSVWVEIPDTIDEQVMNFVTLHVSVWVEIQNDVKIGEDL